MNLKEALDQSLVKIYPPNQHKWLYEPGEVFMVFSPKMINRSTFTELLHILKDEFVITAIDKEYNRRDFIYRNGLFQHEGTTCDKEEYLQITRQMDQEVKRKYFRKEYFDARNSAIYRKISCSNSLFITMVEMSEEGKDVWGS